MSDSMQSPTSQPADDRHVGELPRYIYRHFSDLLTEEERAAENVWIARAKAYARLPGDWPPEPREEREKKYFELFKVPELSQRFPSLMPRIAQHGVGAVMMEAAQRVLRDNADRKILHLCEKCGALCRTPVARQCFECGHDWHDRA